MAWLSSLFGSGGGAAAGGMSELGSAIGGDTAMQGKDGLDHANEMMQYVGGSGQDQQTSTPIQDTSAGQSAYSPVGSQIGQQQNPLLDSILAKKQPQQQTAGDLREELRRRGVL